MGAVLAKFKGPSANRIGEFKGNIRWCNTRSWVFEWLTNHLQSVNWEHHMQSVLVSSSLMNEEKLNGFSNVPNRQLSKIDDKLYELIIVHNGLYVSSDDSGKHKCT